jgi:AMMECR1 domain-containing protein
LQNNKLTVKIWIVDSYINLKGKTENEKLYGVSINKPGILINKDNLNFYCYLPSVWNEQNDAVYILENLAENAKLNKDAWKDSNLDLITFKSNPLIIN